MEKTKPFLRGDYKTAVIARFLSYLNGISEKVV